MMQNINVGCDADIVYIKNNKENELQLNKK